MNLKIEKGLGQRRWSLSRWKGSGVAIQGWNDELFDASADLEGDAKRLTISRILKTSWFLI